MPHRPETAYVALAPDWVCEILSPSSAVIDRARKLAIYARDWIPASAGMTGRGRFRSAG
jgi:Uma2 family endonuclease